MMAPTEEKLDEIGGRLEYSPRKSLEPLAKKVQVSTRTAWIATENLYNGRIKLDRVKQLKMAITREERVFVTGFYGQYIAVCSAHIFIPFLLKMPGSG
jgi:hypothetical protein